MVRLLLVNLLWLSFVPAVAGQQPWPTAAADAPHGVLRFRILDGEGAAVPGRLLFLKEDGGIPELFTNRKAAPGRLAVRANVLYSLKGEEAVTVPAGTYRVIASKGLEWSIQEQAVTVTHDGETAAIFRLRHEVDTSGWVSGDFHLHTLTFSGHGDSNLKERIISLVGEGVEFAVATDHNHHTDYGPTITELGARERITAVTGNEVSVPIGHFNVFPLEPDRPVPDPESRDANTLFALLRAETNRFGVVPVIQVNHPRWGSIDAFGRLGLDPVTATSGDPAWSWDFDSIEVFNENEGWGYHDAERTGIDIGSSRHSVLRDWFHLLNAGHRYRAVGNSDSHHVSQELAGYPRNFVRSPTDEPGRIAVAAVAASVRSGTVFTTLGPFVEFSAGGAPMGGMARARDGGVEVAVRIQAASWIDCDRVKVVVNGDVVQVVPVPDGREVLRLDTRVWVPVASDSWITLLIEGDDPLDPVTTPQKRPVRPYAVMNPVWVDADGDGAWTAPNEQATARVRSAKDQHAVITAWRRLAPSGRALTVLAAAREKIPTAPALARLALEDAAREVRLAAARAVERLADPALAPAVAKARGNVRGDPYADVALLRARHACEPGAVRAELLALVEEPGRARLRRYREELTPLLPGGPLTHWHVTGPLRTEEPAGLLAWRFGPEDASTPDLKGWKLLEGTRAGRMDLRALRTEKEDLKRCAVYALTTVVSPDEREVLYAFGSDDCARLWVNGELLLEDARTQGVDPWRHVGRMRLNPGPNRILVKVVNGSGGFGFALRIIDEVVNDR